MCPTTTMVTSTILALSSHGSRSLAFDEVAGCSGWVIARTIERQEPARPVRSAHGRGLDWRPWPCPGDSEWRRTPSSCATSASCCRSWRPGSPPTSSGPCPGVGSTTERTRGTPSSARSARRPASTRSSASRLACTPPTRPACAATGDGPTTTRCGSCTTGGCRPMPRAARRRGRRLDGRLGLAPARRRARRHRAHRADGPAGAGRLVAVPDAAGRRVRPGAPRRSCRGRRAARPVLGQGLPHRLVEPARWRHRPRRTAGRRAGPRGRGGVRA